MTDLHERCQAHIHKYQAEIDRNGWSDDLLERILIAFVQHERAAALEQAATICDLMSLSTPANIAFGLRMIAQQEAKQQCDKP